MTNKEAIAVLKADIQNAKSWCWRPNECKAHKMAIAALEQIDDVQEMAKGMLLRLEDARKYCEAEGIVEIILHDSEVLGEIRAIEPHETLPRRLVEGCKNGNTQNH